MGLSRKMYHLFKRTPRVTNISDIIILNDEYIDWLTFANAGMLRRGNLYCIDYVAKHIHSNNPIIEIGSFCGLSTNVINYYFYKQKRHKIITSDKWEFEGQDDGMLGDSNISHTAYKQLVQNSFKRNIQLFSFNNLPLPIEAISDDFFDLWARHF